MTNTREVSTVTDIKALETIYSRLTAPEDLELCERLVTLFYETDLGTGREPATEDEENEYNNGMRKLLAR